MLLNKEIADLNQDPLGWSGRLANNFTSTAGEVWRKKMADGSIVAVLFNKQHLSQPPREMVLDFASVGVPQHTEESKARQVTVRDLWKKQNVGSNASDGSWTLVVPSHGVAVLRLSGFASTLPLKTDDERSGRAFYALHVADLSAPGWPSHFQHYDLFIASLGFSEKDIKKVKEDVPNARVLAYTDWSWAYVDAGCSHADGPKHSHFNFTSYFKQSWAITDLNTGEPVCPFGPVDSTAPKPVWGVAATVLMKESADALARWHSEVTLAGGYDGLYIHNWHASFSASWGKSLLALTNGSFDCNGDGKPDTLTTLQAQYSAWKPYYSMQLRRVLGDKLLLANTGNVAEADASLDGQTIEFEWCATSRGGVRACEAALDAQHAVSLAQGNGREAISVMWLTEANNVAAVVQCRELLQLQSTRQWLLGGTDRSDKSWPANASCGVPGGRVKADNEAVVYDAAEGLSETVVFRHGDGGMKCVRSPNLLLAGKRLVAMTEAWNYTGNNCELPGVEPLNHSHVLTGYQRFLFRTSDTSGRTWTGPRFLPLPQLSWNAQLVYFNGRIIVMAAVKATGHLLTISSDDGAESWSKPVDISNYFPQHLISAGPPWTGMKPAYGSGVVLPHNGLMGRILMTAYSSCCCFVLTSTDGTTWELASTIEQAFECSVAWLGKHNVYLNARHSKAVKIPASATRIKRVTATSENDGFHFVRNETLSTTFDPDSGGVRGDTLSIVNNSSRTLLFAIAEGPLPYPPTFRDVRAPRGRQNLALHRSLDTGVQWSSQLLRPGYAGYVSLAHLPGPADRPTIGVLVEVGSKGCEGACALAFLSVTLSTSTKKDENITAGCNVANYSDCTAPLQTAFDTVGATLIHVPQLAGSSPWIVGDGSTEDRRQQYDNSRGQAVMLPSHRKIVFEAGVSVLAKKGEFHASGSFLFQAHNATNLTIVGYGASWQMRKSDYANRAVYQWAQNRHALALFGCSDITILGLTIRSSGGDGILIAGLSPHGRYNDALLGYSTNVLLQDFVSDDNYRNAMSVVAVSGLTVSNSRFTNSNGTGPNAGIDFEPNNCNNRLERILLTNTTIAGCTGNAIDIFVNKLGSSDDVNPCPPLSMTDISFRGLLVESCSRGGIFYDAAGDGAAAGTLVVEHAIMRNLSLAAIMLELTTADHHHTRLEDVTIYDVATGFRQPWPNGSSPLPAATSPILLGDPKYGRIVSSYVGGMSFRNVTVRDRFDRPWATYVGSGQRSSDNGVGSADIIGSVTVANPHGCRHELGNTTGKDGMQLIDLQVACQTALKVDDKDVPAVVRPSLARQVCLYGVVNGRVNATAADPHKLCSRNLTDSSFVCGPAEAPTANLAMNSDLGVEDFSVSAELMLVRPIGHNSASSIYFVSAAGDDHVGLDAGPPPDTLFTEGVHWTEHMLNNTRTPDSGQWFKIMLVRSKGVITVHINSTKVLTLPMDFAVSGFVLRPWRSAMHIRSLSVCAAAIPAPPPPPPPPSPPETEIFVHGEAGCVCIGIPALILTRNRTVLAFAECRMWQGDGCHLSSSAPPISKNPNCSGTCIVMKRSGDGGDTWSLPHLAARAGGNPMPVYDAVRGIIVLNYALGSANDPPYIQAAANVMCTISATDGTGILDDASWSSPRSIAQYPHGWANHPGPNAAVQLRPGTAHAGRLVFSGWLHNNGKTCDAVVWLSDDGGATFRPGKGGFINGTCEVGVSQMADGRVVLLGNDGGSQDHGPCPGNTLQHYFSSDGGDSFGPVICDTALVNSDCQAPVLVVGDRIVVANPEGLPLGTRTAMTIHASDDEQGHKFSTVPAQCRNSTASWPCFDSGAGLDKTVAGYSSLTFVDSRKPQTVGLAWETSGPGATCVGERCRVLFSVFDVPIKSGTGLEALANSDIVHGGWVHVLKADDEAVVRPSLARHTLARVSRHARAPRYAAWGPSTIGKQIGDRANSQVLLDKLTLYSQWAKAEPRIGGFAPWHYSDYRVNPDCGVPTCSGPERACDWIFGASHYPAVVSRLQQIGRSILMRPVPHKSDDNEAGVEGPPATTALARGGITITPVFSRGEGGCSAYRIPGIQSLNGTLLVFAECRKYDCGDFGGQHNVAFKRSTDGGASFSEVQTLLDPMVMFSAEQCPTDAASVRSQNSSCVFWDPVCSCPSRCGLTNSRD
jgi:hypothetical protein